ncbi:MAG: hypothetical protein Rubg2KO_18430 [Rubricoccaceae bacterium]
MWATDNERVPLFTRPTNSSMVLPPGPGMGVGSDMWRGMGVGLARDRCNASPLVEIREPVVLTLSNSALLASGP